MKKVLTSFSLLALSAISGFAQSATSINLVRYHHNAKDNLSSAIAKLPVQAATVAIGEELCLTVAFTPNTVSDKDVVVVFLRATRADIFSLTSVQHSMQVKGRHKGVEKETVFDGTYIMAGGSSLVCGPAPSYVKPGTYQVFRIVVHKDGEEKEVSPIPASPVVTVIKAK